MDTIALRSLRAVQILPHLRQWLPEITPTASKRTFREVESVPRKLYCYLSHISQPNTNTYRGTLQEIILHVSEYIRDYMPSMLYALASDILRMTYNVAGQYQTLSAVAMLERHLITQT
jgi:hypothetical protein